MSRTQESGAYLGGIGAMLEMADVCPGCGQVHSDRQFGFKHGAPRECPLVVMGSFPVMSLPNPPVKAPVRVVTPRRPRLPEAPSAGIPISTGSLPFPSAESDRGRSRSLGVPWLPPPDLGEVL